MSFVESHVVNLIAIRQLFRFDWSHPMTSQLHIEQELHRLVVRELFRSVLRLLAIGESQFVVDDEVDTIFC